MRWCWLGIAFMNPAGKEFFDKRAPKAPSTGKTVRVFFGGTPPPDIFGTSTSENSF